MPRFLQRYAENAGVPFTQKQLRAVSGFDGFNLADSRSREGR